MITPSSSRIHVRRATVHDLEDVDRMVDIINGAYTAPDTWTSVRHFGVKTRIQHDELEDLVRHKIMLFAYDGDEPVGTVQIEPLDADEAEMAMLSVDPTRQSQGIGGRLVQAGMDTIKAMGYKRAVVSILGERPELLAWYLKLGFQDSGERPPYINPSVIKTVLPLTVVKKDV